MRLSLVSLVSIWALKIKRLKYKVWKLSWIKLKTICLNFVVYLIYFHNQGTRTYRWVYRCKIISGGFDIISVSRRIWKKWLINRVNNISKRGMFPWRTPTRTGNKGEKKEFTSWIKRKLSLIKDKWLVIWYWGCRRKDALEFPQ